jgi:predicted adenylyl cyclase CyaB
MLPTLSTNIEIKAHAQNFTQIKARAETLSDAPVEVITQEDTFFNTPQGRLKLRVLPGEQSQLIYYARSEKQGPKRSDYHIFRTADAENLKRVLELAFGVRGVVRKTRYLYLVGQTRIHLDNVEGLGQFVELEVVLQEGQSEAEGQAIAESLMASLGVEKNDLLAGAYMDLLESSPDPAKIGRIV